MVHYTCSNYAHAQAVDTRPFWEERRGHEAISRCAGALLSRTLYVLALKSLPKLFALAWLEKINNNNNNNNQKEDEHSGVYRKSVNFRCSNIFVVSSDYENKKHETFPTANN